MLDAPIIEDLHRIRRDLASEFNGDVHAFFCYLRDREAKRQDRSVTLKPNAPVSTSGTTKSE